ncbi:bifunctional DNA primase/polymerase [Mycolicibacterium porcinum]|uniref:Bifunctional DNA primase/polymerase n=1 Tax=Mycolicibacterium porcinum TaxID=39693 RepID=A0ABV3VN33_9MYCO
MLSVLSARAPEDQTPLAVALGLANLGIPVLPVWTRESDDGKHKPKSPATLRGYRDASTDPDVIKRWFTDTDYGVAFRPRDARMVILDADRVESVPALRAFVADVWGLTEAQSNALPWTIRSANSQNPEAKSYQGGHLAVFVPEDKDFPLFPIRALVEHLGVEHIDILGGTEDRIVVAPPTRIDGFHYRITGPALPYTSAFGAVLAQFAQRVADKQTRTQEVVSPDVQASRDAFAAKVDSALTWDDVFAGTRFKVNGNDGACITMHYDGASTEKSLTVHHESACKHGAGGVTVFSQSVLSDFPSLRDIADKRGSVSDTPTFTRLQFYAALQHAGSVRDALTALGIARDADYDGAFDATVHVVAEPVAEPEMRTVDGTVPVPTVTPVTLPLYADRVPVTLGRVTRHLSTPSTGTLEVDIHTVTGTSPITAIGVSMGSPLPEGVDPIPFTLPDIDGLEDDGSPYSDPMLKVLTESSPLLRHCTTAARQRGLGPLAVIAGMQRAVASNIPTKVAIPGVVSGPSPLNVIHLALGPSGAGKSGSADSVVAVQRYRPGHLDTSLVGGVVDEDPEFVINPVPKLPGSGQALATFYAENVKDKDADGKEFWTTEQHTHSVSVVFDEVDGLVAQLSNDKNTLSAELRTGWSGVGPIGSNVKTKANDITVEGWNYRLVVLIAAQTLNATGLFDNASGGLSQRMHTVGVEDPHPLTFEEKVAQRPVGIYRITIPDVQMLDLPVSIQREVWDARKDGALKPDSDYVSEDGHRMLVRLREAAILALAHGYVGITPEIWEWSRWWVEHSRRAQSTVLAARAKQRKGMLVGKGTDEAYIGRVKEVENAKRFDRALAAVDKWVESNPDKPLTRSELSRGPASRVRKELGKGGFADFLEYMVDVAGWDLDPATGAYTRKVEA